MSAKPLDEIRSADRAVEEIARQVLTREPQRSAQDGEVLYYFDMSIAGGLSEPVAAPFDHEPEISGVPRHWNPVVVLAEADHNGLPGADVLEALLYLADPEAKCRQIAEKAKEPIRERIPIGSFTELVDYVGVSLKYETVVPIYPREIVKRALEHGACAVIMVHNHPSGDPTPSNADVTFSQQVERALSVMNIALHDSLIIGKNSFASLRSLGRL